MTFCCIKIKELKGEDHIRKTARDIEFKFATLMKVAFEEICITNMPKPLPY